MSNRIEDLDGRAQPALRAALEELTQKKVPHVLWSTRRGAIHQSALYSQSRASREIVNLFRFHAGLGEVNETEAARWVTDCDGWKKASEHQGGLAADVIPTRNGKAWWPSPQNPLWKKIAVVMKKHGFEAGMDWPKPDYPHYTWRV